MGLKNRICKKANAAAGTLFSILPVKGIKRPLFIIGCGRSGTTILGTILSMHGKVTYLNEPRKLWTAAYPKTNIWKNDRSGNRGNLSLTAADTERRSSKRLSRLFRFETIKTGKPVLIEKLPANSFRLQFIRKIFPDARFIHLYRNGLEVARSIEKFCQEGKWFCANPYKWKQLSHLARSSNGTAALPELCTDYFYMGLLEWRLNTAAVTGFLELIPKAAYIEISYNDLLDNPGDTISRILDFIGLEPDPDVSEFAHQSLVRRSMKIESMPLSEKEKIIGGELLPVSLKNTSGLTQDKQLATDSHKPED